MRNSSFHILRVGMAITFLWIGVLILKQPENWSALIMPWARDVFGLITGDVDGFLHNFMISTAILDLLVGFFLLIDRYVFLAALFGAFHLLGVIITTDLLITVRDIGLLAGSVALMLHVLPYPFTKPASAKDWLKIISR